MSDQPGRLVEPLAGQHLPLSLLAAWGQKSFPGPSRVITEPTPQVMHMYIHGRLGANVGKALQEATTASIVNRLVMVVHLHTVQQATAAGFGARLDARRQMLEGGPSLTLSGLNFKMRFLLYAWRLQPPFDEWQPAISRGRSFVLKTEAPLHINLGADQDALPAQTRSRG